MMGIYIKGMNMPMDCDECRFAYRGACIANIGREVKVDQICPLVEVPEGEMFAVKDDVLYKALVKMPQGKVAKIPIIEVSDTEGW